jgi:hypothetical protein
MITDAIFELYPQEKIMLPSDCAMGRTGQPVIRTYLRTAGTIHLTISLSFRCVGVEILQ